MKTTAPVVLLAVAAMVLSLTTLGALLGVRLVASDRLRHMSEAMKELGNASIETTITVRQTLPLSAQISIVKPTQIDLTLDVADKIPIRLEVKVDETLTVPLDLQIDEQIPLETAMTIAKKSRVRVKADIDLEQPVRLPFPRPCGSVAVSRSNSACARSCVFRWPSRCPSTRCLISNWPSSSRRESGFPNRFISRGKSPWSWKSPSSSP